VDIPGFPSINQQVVKAKTPFEALAEGAVTVVFDRFADRFSA
jgi:hypothetical protein